MDWSDTKTRQEFEWLRLMARLKYDSYRDFQAGIRFLENLATWLQQFCKSERRTAYDFVRKHLVYITPSEMQKLAEQFYPRIILDRVVQMVAAERKIPTYSVFSDEDTTKAIQKLLRQTLVMGLSDGARLDIVRHANVGRLNNEQIALTTQIDAAKWEDLLKELREELNDDTALFRLVCLVDDFTGSGTSFLRWNQEKKEWSGKLIRFWKSVTDARKALCDAPIFDSAWQLSIHHYISSSQADVEINKSLDVAKTAFEATDWASEIHVSTGFLLPADIKVDATKSYYKEFHALTQHYYNTSIETKHTIVGGVEHIGLGFAGCALPLVLEHNTPNNSVALLWAETRDRDKTGDPAHAMRPLFRRRQRHV